MKKIISAAALSFVMCCCIMCGIAFAKNDALCEKFVRVHVLANSDSPFDQGIKIAVRDYIFEKYKNEFAGFNTKEETLVFLNDNCKDIENEINKYLKHMNCDYFGKIVFSKSRFPEKMYGGITLPKGNYDAFKVVLGKGKGKNFFCVMFPPMCVEETITVNTRLNDIVTEEEKKLLSGNITYKFKIAEILKKVI